MSSGTVPVFVSCQYDAGGGELLQGKQGRILD
jgi:hypothetical protein